LGINPKIYQASTSELFNGTEGVQDENTPKDPVSPYGTAKLYGFQIAKNYREAFGMFIVNGILFNHESGRRGDNFVTKKIANEARAGNKLHLGNIDASRDWGYAPEYMEAAWLMLQQAKPDDYVIATGETHTVKEFVGWIEELKGKKLKIITSTEHIRPHDVTKLQGNPAKAERLLGWRAKVKGKGIAEKIWKYINN
jgi:GDPmannose 4,6-dehydratase